MYTLTFKDGTTCIGYFKEGYNRTYWVDEQGWELKDELIINCEKI